ncbi:glycosyltransferase family 2 protein [Agarivorans sp. TSD2052]|uniref:glycosyltransferase family 2 protein n=1 Tax=Agarivorans sp. TSD2052 TaxID=2937286 RepID=UPI00200D3F53|nr:glycosyltransferase family 2 protein [Agarivorans sp. TSD2052]UPW19411.1 glycosyltransferase family 2 protein [Agarivorans sp. TSD2052]
MDAKTSVIIPYYNNDQYIDKALQSVFQQTAPALEILVVNDGSKEDSRSFLEKYAQQVTIIDHPMNRGIAEARNTGAKQAKGEFLAFLDADDYWESNKLALQQQLMQDEAELSGCHCGTRIFSEEGSANETCINKPEYLALKDSLVDSHIVPSSWLVKREHFIQAGGFDPNVVAEDYDLFLTLLSQGHQYKFINQALVWFRRSNQGNESARWQYIYYGRLKVFKKHWKDLYKEGGLWALSNNLQRTFELASWRAHGLRHYLFRLVSIGLPQNYKGK